MKLLFDLSNHTSIYSGVTVYALRILEGFRDNHYENITILCNSQILDYIQHNFPDYKCIRANINNGRNVLLSNGYNWTKQINKINCDIIFSPNIYPTYIFCNKKIVQTIHDLQPLKVFKGKSRLAFQICLPLLILRSKKIISISEYVKNEIVHFYPFIKKRKIKSISNCIITHTPEINKNPIGKHYLLYVSSLWKYKNIMTLLKAFNINKDKIEQDLVIIGKQMDNSWKDEALPFIKTEHLENRIIHIEKTISNEKLAQFYEYADLFIHPSLLEGFGYTPIEAAMHNAPVISSKETALYETTLGLLNYYEPATDYKALSDKILDILKDPPTLQQRTEIKNIYSKKYNYIKQAQEVYNFLLNTYNE